MKRTISVIAVLSMCSILLAVAGNAGAASIGKFTFVLGRVDITSPGKAASPVKVGDEVQAGDAIRTKSRARAEITFVDGSVMRLAQKTRVKITQYMVEKEQRNSIFSLFRGKIQNIVKKFLAGSFGRYKKNRYEVHTPTAVVGVRGTNFFTYITKDGGTGAAFMEGQGYGYSANRPQDGVTINTGQAMLSVSADQVPVIKPASGVELQQHLNDTAPSGDQSGGGSGGDDTTGGLGGGDDTLGGQGGNNGGNGSGSGGGTGGDTIVNTDPTFQQQTTTTTTTPGENEIAILGDLGLDFLDQGAVNGTLNTTTNQGSISLSGTYTGSPGGSQSGNLQGTLGSGAFSGYTGLAIGSFKGTYSTIYTQGGAFVQDPATGDYALENAGVGYLYGAFSGQLDDAQGILSAGGSAYRSGQLGTVDTINVGAVPAGETPSDVLPGRLAENFSDLQSNWGLPIPVLGSINAGGDFGTGTFTPNIVSGGLELTGGRRIGVWGVDTTGGQYTNATNLGTWYGIYGEMGAAGSPAGYYLLGSVEGNDDLAIAQGQGSTGHLSVDGTLTYLDPQYLGTVYLWNRGTYDAAGNYQSGGSGTFTLDPLVLSGQTEGSLMYFDDESQSLENGGAAYGLIGAVASNPNQITILGHYDISVEQAAYLMYGSGFQFTGGSPSGDQSFYGYLVGNMTNGAIDARALALAIAGGQAGLRGGTVSGYNYEGINLFGVTGSIPFTPIEPTTVSPADLAGSIVPYEIYGYGSGSFSAGGNIYLSNITGDPIRIMGHDWGIWNAGLGGTYTGSTSDGWTLVHGADFSDADGGAEGWGLLLGRITDTTWGDSGISGNYEGTGITPLAFYDLTGPVSGTRQETGESGNWQAVGIGTFERRPLTFFSEIYPEISDASSGVTGDLWVLLGGDTSLWGPDDTPITGIGTYSTNTGGLGSIWLDPYFTSWNESTLKETTLEDTPGAFTGVMGGIKNGDALEALIAALYIDPSGNAGFLSSTDTSGMLYGHDPSIVTGGSEGILEMNGTIQRRQMATNIGIAPENLEDNVYPGNGAEGNIFKLAGTLGTTGDLFGTGTLDTLSIVDSENHIASPWGIYYADQIYGNFYNPNGAGTFSSRVGGTDYFGAYFDSSGAEGDPGWFYGNTASTWANNRLEADLDAAFLTRTKMGGWPWQAADTGLQGTVLGTYHDDTNALEAVSIGTWVGEPLSYSAYFGSNIADYSGKTGQLEGLMGSTGSLWGSGSTPVGLMGDYTLSLYDLETCIWQDALDDEVTSYNPMTGQYTTQENNPGAFKGAIGGIKNGDSLEALFAAIYIDPADTSGISRAGLLTSTDIAGSADPDLGLFQMTGNIQRRQMTDDIGIAPEHLIDKLYYGTLDTSNNISLGGTLGSNGSVYTDEFHPDLRFDTISILDEANRIAPPWGIYYASLFGYYENPDNAATWNSIVAGFDNFGVYFPNGGESAVGDFGYFHASTASSFADNRLEADLGGRFVAMGKMGGWPWQAADTGLQGKVLGTYNPATGTWEGVSLGTWVGEPTTFSSDFRNDPDGFPLWQLVQGTSHAAEYERTDGEGGYNGQYNYEYFQADPEANAGDILYGERWENDDTAVTKNESVWLPTGDRYDFAYSREPEQFIPFTRVGEDSWTPGTPPPSDTAFTTLPPGTWEERWTNNWDSNAIAQRGNFSGILGTTQNVWDATQASPASYGLMGILEPVGDWDVGPFLFGVDIRSSGLTPGAYAGYLGGLFYNVTDDVISYGISDMMGTSYALYIDPTPVSSYQAGVLKGPFSGNIYWATYYGGNAAALWDGLGTIYPIPQEVVNVSPADFNSDPSAYLDEGFIAGWLYGGADGGPEISGFGWGNTLAFKDHDDFGIFNMFFGYDNKVQDPGNWTAMVGGWAEFGAHPVSGGGTAPDIGMYVIDPTTVTQTGELLLANYTGEFLTYSKYGQLQGDLIGAQVAGTDGWIGATAGYWHSGQALEFNGIFEGNFWGMADTGDTGNPFSMQEVSRNYGLLGSLDPLWTSTNTSAAQSRLMGEADDFDTWSAAPPVFSATLRSYNPWDDTVTIWKQADNSQNGAYYGYAAGRTTEQNTGVGGILALGLDPSGNVDFLLGDVNATYYPNPGILLGDASMFPVQVLTAAETGLTGADAQNFFPGGILNASSEGGAVNMHGQFMDENDNPIGGNGDINVTDWVSWFAHAGGEIDGVPWAMSVRNSIYAGKYNDVPGVGTSNYWEIPFARDDGVVAKQGAFFSSNESDLTRGEWQSAKISGKGYGAWVNWDEAVTGISGGDIKGTFDPNTRTWQMAALWASMDTKTFANLLATPEGRDKLKLLNMPYVQIGQTTLSQGPGTVNGMQNVTMNDVKFLAYSTGGAPRAFMSPDVGGQHNGTVAAGGPAVQLNGAQGISASFQVNRWDGPGGNWGANITGGGTYTGTGTLNTGNPSTSTIQMSGSGAGKIGTSTFSGTASGTAKLAPPD